jgi:hypothetical protein
MGTTREIRNELKPFIALEPQVINSDTTTVGEIIDTADFDGGIVFVQSIAWTAGTVTPLIEESSADDFGSDVSDVADANLVGDVETGQEADSALTTGALISSLGVVGNVKRYLRYSMVSTGSANVVASAVALAKSEVSPISN